MTTRTRAFAKTLVAAAAATAPVVALAPTAQAAPAPQPLPRTPLPPLPAAPLPATPTVSNPVTLLPTLPMVETTVTRVVSVPVANVRSGPGTNHGVVGTKTSGTTVRGVISTNGWLKISSSEFMAPSVLSTPSTGSVTQYLTADVGNVRSGPGTNYRVVGTKTRGTEVRGSWVNGWLDLGNGQFISGTILTSTAPGGGGASGGGGGGGTATETVTRWVTVAANVRSGPSTSHSIVGSRQAGAQVSGQLTTNGWLQIAGGQFMSPGVLTSTNPSGGSGGGGGATETVKRWVSASVANVRSGPSTSYAVTGTRTAGTEVNGTISTNGWLRMSSTQWMSPSVLSTTPPTSTPAPTPVTPPPPADATPLRQSILNTAKQYVGYPYVLYGTPPDAFDCSSYTWWVYKQNGINIPRTVRDQKAMVVRVTDPQPGDLIFYDDFYHVGIYAGDGKTYEALNPSAGVRYGDPVSTRIWFGRIPGM